MTTLEIPLNKYDWTDTGILLVEGDTLSINAGGIGGVNKGSGGEPETPPGGAYFWVTYPEGSYIAYQPGTRYETPYQEHAEEPENTQTVATLAADWFPTNFRVQNCAPFGLVGLILPDGETPPAGSSFVENAFRINRAFSSSSLGAGRLWVLFNDLENYFDDNYGVFTVQIEVEGEEPEEPEEPTEPAEPLTIEWGNFPVFPLAFEESSGDRSHRTLRHQLGNANRFEGTLDIPLWNISLGGLTILDEFIDEWDAFHAMVAGMWKPFLFRLMSRSFEIEKDQPNGIGTGDGIKKTFQLVKTRSYPYGPATVESQIVRFPWHRYPEMRVPIGNPINANGTRGTLLYKTDTVRIWVNDVEKNWPADFAVNRETGAITFTEAPASGALIQASCLFFILVHGQDSYKLQHSGSKWSFPEGAHLFQVTSEAR